MYHYFGAPPGPDPEKLFVDRPMFEAQLDHLDRTGWRALSLDEYLAALDGAPTPRRSFLLTIDDGHESVGRLAAPLLAERGIPSVLFVCPGLLGDHARWTPPYREERLSPAADLRALPGLGMELGVHSWNHTRMVDLDAAVATALDTSAMAATAREISVESRGEHGLEVFGSQEQIGAAVSNLVANAVAYSNTGSRVVVTTRSEGGQVQISVVDQGIGIPAEDIDRIFERFYRVDPARHRSTGGTGLGLSIVKHVAATHGGEVRVWSVEGQGSTFTLSLPQHLGSGLPATEPTEQHRQQEERP
jgi:anti-sigma regulatory factor (Ser/Thr protein kinase)